MTAIRINSFRGMAPRLGPKLLAKEQAQEARNCNLVSGELRPWATTGAPQTSDSSLEKTGTIKTIHLFNRDFWLHWVEDVDVERGPIADDTQERTYYTVNDGDTTPPRVTDATLATEGTSGEWPTNYYRLGVPAPASAPSVSVNSGSGSTCDAADQESTVYVYTYVTGWGEEGPPSDPSAVVDRCDADTVTVSGMDTGASGNYDWDVKRIYRAVTGAEGTEYQFVAEVGIATTSYDDDVDTADLGEVLPSATWSPPPDDLVGLTMLPNGIAAGFKGQDLYLSEAYLPHAWPTEYRQTLEHAIVGIGAFGQSLVVCTEGQPYIAQGTDPASYTAQQLPMEQGCSSKRSIVGIEGGVIYASPDGLVQVGGQGAQIITDAVMDREDWQALKPSSILGVYHDRRYFGFYDDGTTKAGFIFDPRDPESGMTWIDLHATAAFSDLLTDTLYLVDANGDLVVWNTGAGNQTATWKSAVFPIPYETNFGALQVVATSYNSVTAKVYADGALKATKTLTGPRPVRLPAGFRAREWEVQVEATDDVQEIVMAETIGEIGRG